MSERLVRLTKDDGSEKRWIVVGERGAVDFHCTHAHSENSRKYGRIGGVEFHYRWAQDYMGPGYGCTSDFCWVLGGQCWHDGSSLWASEKWIPLLERAGEDAVWRELEDTYYSRMPLPEPPK